MVIGTLKQNIEQIKEIIREMYIFTNQLEIIKRLESASNISISTREKKLLNDTINSLLIQLRILNDSVPQLIENIKFFKKLESDKGYKKFIKGVDTKKEGAFVQLKYKPMKSGKKIEVTIDDKNKTPFLENLSKSNLSINKLKKEFSIRAPITTDFGKSNIYARISNHFFRDFSKKLLNKGYLSSLNINLRKINSRFVVGTYTSIILLTITVFGLISLFLLGLLLFYNFNIAYPFLTPVDETILLRLVKFFWVIFIIPLGVGGLLYYYPRSEAKSLGYKIDQELPFVTIHMSAIAGSGVEPLNIFKIVIKSAEYRYTKVLFRRLVNLINFHGYDLVTALKLTAQASPSAKLKELLDGISTNITSGGSLHIFLNQHADSLLFDYKLERERYIKTAETFMDIYISIVIAAPMILLILFVIMGSTGMYFMGITPDFMGFLIILAIVFLNSVFLIFLKLKQPAI